MRIKIKNTQRNRSNVYYLSLTEKKNSLRLVIFLSKLSIAVNKIEIRNRKM